MGDASPVPFYLLASAPPSTGIDKRQRRQQHSLNGSTISCYLSIRSLLVSSVDVISRENRAEEEEEKERRGVIENYDVTILVYQSSMLHGQHLKRSMQEGVLWAFV